MEFLDEDARPRFVFQSRPSNSLPADQEAIEKPGKLFLFTIISISGLLLVLSVFLFQSDPYKSILLWVSLSLLVGPFAPVSITGGDIRVGRGSVVEFYDEQAATDEDNTKRASQKRSKIRRSEELGVVVVPVIQDVNGSLREKKKTEANPRGNDSNGNGFAVKEEKDWTEEDIEVLKKQLLKHPVGKPRRWEMIAEAFRGRHKMENVIKKAKELGQKKSDDSESYSQFLKKRKPMDKRNDPVIENWGEGYADKGESDQEADGDGSGMSWSTGEDMALLNALKAFPKDVSMRWEKITAAVPGKSKAACMKRITELKKEFRSAKAAATDG